MTKLIRQTSNGQASWSPGSRGDQVIYSTIGSSVTIESTDNDQEPPFRLRILNGDGHVVATVIFEARSPHLDLARELFLVARRNSLKVDETLDALLGNDDAPW